MTSKRDAGITSSGQVVGNEQAFGKYSIIHDNEPDRQLGLHLMNNNNEQYLQMVRPIVGNPSGFGTACQFNPRPPPTAQFNHEFTDRLP
jgi:hypothetical protein